MYIMIKEFSMGVENKKYAPRTDTHTQRETELVILPLTIRFHLIYTAYKHNFSKCVCVRHLLEVYFYWPASIRLASLLIWILLP